MNDYVDIREIHPDYTTIPCMECDGSLFVPLSFAFCNDEWYCSDCEPQKLKDIPTGPDVTVNL